MYVMHSNIIQELKLVLTASVCLPTSAEYTCIVFTIDTLHILMLLLSLFNSMGQISTNSCEASITNMKPKNL